MNDEFDLRDVKPEDFIDATVEHFYEHSPANENFQQFLDRHLYSTRYAFVVADGQSNPVTALSDGHVERLYGAEDGETIVDYLARMRRRATAAGANRFFFSRLIITTRVLPGSTEEIDASDPRWGATLMWHAEDRISADTSTGSMPVISKNLLGAEDHSGGLATGWLKDALEAVLR